MDNLTTSHGKHEEIGSGLAEETARRKEQKMSEIQDSVQIMELLGEVTIKLGGASLEALRFLYSLYYNAKLNGAGAKDFKTVMGNCAERGIAPQIMNIATENPEEIAKLEQGLKKFGMQFAILPDHKEDGLTQIMFPTDQASLFRAYMEKNVSIACKEISLNDYCDMCPPEERQRILTAAAEEAQQNMTLDEERKKKLEGDLLGAFGQEITLDDSLFLEQTGDAFLFQIPNSKGELGLVLPREEVKQVVGTSAFSVNMRREAEYQTVNLKSPGADSGKLKGEALLAYFSEPYHKGKRRIDTYGHVNKQGLEKRKASSKRTRR